MKTSSKGLALIKKYEGFFSKPYLDPVNIPTIGYGVIKYPNGKRVTMQDKPITEKQASDILAQLLEQTYEKEVNRLVKSKINQNQFDALVSFVYNLGGTNFAKSTLLMKINNNPNDPSISKEFPRWNKAGGKVLNGLTKRRVEESELYFTPVISLVGTTYTTTSDLNVREGAGTNFRVLWTLPKGTIVEEANRINDWSRIISPIEGWCNNKFFK